MSAAQKGDTKGNREAGDFFVIATDARLLCCEAAQKDDTKNGEGDAAVCDPAVAAMIAGLACDNMIREPN
jgi:hypothetical protein